MNEAILQCDGWSESAATSLTSRGRSSSGQLAAVLVGLFSLVFAGCGALPEVEVRVQGEPITSEEGASVDVLISLVHAPKGVVLVQGISSAPGEGRVSGPLRFDLGNWREPQILTVSGVDDGVPDGDVAYEVSVQVSSFQHWEPAELAVLQFVNRARPGVRFVGVGDLPGGDVASHVTGVSASGEVVVGWSRNARGDQAVRWTPAGGLRGLSGDGSQALGVSADGTLTAGFVPQTNGDLSTAAVVWADDGEPVQLRALDPPGWFPVRATVVLDDAQAYATCYQVGGRIPFGCRHDPGGPVSAAPLNLSVVHVADSSGAYGGTRLVSRGEAPTYQSVAILSGAALGYPVGAACLVPHRCGSAVRDFSADRSVVVGTSEVPVDGQSIPPTDPMLFDTGFVYTRAEGMLRLRDLPGGPEASGAYAVSASGRMIAGFGTDASGKTATVWLDRVPTTLHDLISARGGVIPEGWTLDTVVAMSDDGRVLVGNGTNPAGMPEGFWVSLPDE